MIKIIGLGEYAVCCSEEDSIKTFALASCIGLVIYDPISKKLGMAHIVHPHTSEKSDLQKGVCFFADKAVPFLFQKVFGRFPDSKTPYRVSLYGGAVSSSNFDLFSIGEKNLKCVEEILIANDIWYDKKNTGGNYSRTITASVKDGSITIKKQPL